MSVRLREADLASDDAALIELARTNLGQTDTASQRFQWLYRDNPYGPARAWLAFDGPELPIGMCALFPRLAYVGGEEILGCVLGDFCVSKEYRTLGPAVQLQRACLSAIESGQFGFGYDFPSRSMLGVYRFLGVSPTQNSVRMAKLLRSAAKIRTITRSSTAARLISKPVDLALKIKDYRTSDCRDLEYRLEEGPCSEQYGRLAKQVGSSLGSCTVRSLEYLNWRYRRHPRLNYEFFACYRGGELQAYCVFSLAEGRAQIVDLFGRLDEAIVIGMLRRLVSLLRKRGVSVVSVEILENDPRTAAFLSLGFQNRGAGPIIFCGATVRRGITPFFLMQGDREG